MSSTTRTTGGIEANHSIDRFFFFSLSFVVDFVFRPKLFNTYLWENYPAQSPSEQDEFERLTSLLLVDFITGNVSHLHTISFLNFKKGMA